MFKWTSESVMAAVAVVITTAGGLTTTAIHWGSVDTQIEAVQKHQNEQDTKLDAAAAAVVEDKIHAARVEQALNDVIARLDRIEKKL